MKQTIAIIIDYISISESDLNVGCGGSETWAIEISKQFAKNDYNVLLFTLNTKFENASYNVHYLPVSVLDNVLSYSKVDYFIISRYFKSQTLDIISKYSLNNNLYIVAHDVMIAMNNKPILYSTIKNNDILNTHLQKIIVMSDFGKHIIQSYSNIPDKYFEIIGNGVNFDENLLDTTQQRDNDLFWSSRYERGLDMFVNQIFPLVKERYPDIKLRVAQYENNLPEVFLNNEDIVFLGRLNKVDLYNEMLKHKVFFYPNIFTETFCITILEAILCENELITVNRYGPATTLKIFNDLILPHDTNFDNPETSQQIADQIIDKLENYNDNNRLIIRKIMKNYMMYNYSWENIYQQFKNKILK